MQTGNPILSWHLQRDLWKTWLDYFAQESDPVDAAAATWVRSLETLRSVTASDPFVVSANDQAARSEDVRNLAAILGRNAKYFRAHQGRQEAR